MQTHTFIKEYDQWFIDLQAYLDGGGAKSDLQMVEGADTMLDIMANGQDRVTLELDIAPFPGADELTLLELCDPSVGGGYYLLATFEGRPIDHQMWLCGVTEFVFGYMPERVYVKRVAN
jgi:hypothetical protein